MLCATCAGAGGISAQLSRKSIAPAAEYGAIGQRTLVELVNASHNGLATKRMDAIDLNSKSGADPNMVTLRSTSQRDALGRVTVLYVQRDDPPLIECGRWRFNRVGQIRETPNGLDVPEGSCAASFGGEAAAFERLCHHDAAAALRGASSNHMLG